MIVVKYGGHVLDQAKPEDEVIEVLASHHRKFSNLVVVHGGAPAVDKELQIHGIETQMRSGYRVTTSEVMEIVQQTLSGSVLRNIVNKFISYKVNAVGLSAADGSIIRGKIYKPIVNGSPVDAGLVAEPEIINTALLELLLASGYLPIISPVSASAEGMALNMNGDIVAGAIAGGLGAEEVIFITDVPGIFRHWPDQSSLIDHIRADELTEIAPSFADGMAPKVKAVIDSLKSGAQSARIVDGRDIASVRLALTGAGGTLVTRL